MTSTTRPRRRRALALRVASIVTTGRLDLGLTKAELARRSGISRQMVGAVEAGSSNPTLEVVASMFHALSLDIDVVVRGVVAIDGGRRRDAAHARCSAYVQRRLEAAGWVVAREVTVGSGRYVGWIDLLAFHRATGIVLVVEIKTRLDDLGAVERSMDWYRRGAVAAARRIGWRPRRVVGWLLALASDEVESAIVAARRPLETSFPARATAMLSFAVDPGAGPFAAGLALIDPRSRRRDWLVRSRADGRRSPTPYRGYAEFMAAIEGRRAPTGKGRRVPAGGSSTAQRPGRATAARSGSP